MTVHRLKAPISARTYSVYQDNYLELAVELMLKTGQGILAANRIAAKTVAHQKQAGEFQTVRLRF